MNLLSSLLSLNMTTSEYSYGRLTAASVLDAVSAFAVKTKEAAYGGLSTIAAPHQA